jgi:Holliday junction resolvasome RuvABC DNA-binding subunit
MVAEAAIQDGGVAQPVDANKLESRRTIADAIEAIGALGYSRGDAKRMVADVMADDAALESLEAITLAVLRRLDVRT